jgi:hypothetical protein
MRKTVVALVLFGSIVGHAGAANAATLQVLLNLVGSRDIDIPVQGPPYVEFRAQRSSWGTATVSGALVGYYVFSADDRRHEVTDAATYPGTQYTVMIRTVGAPAELLVLRGGARPLSQGGGTFGSVIVATGSLAFLRGAAFTTVLAGGNTTVLTLTY